MTDLKNRFEEFLKSGNTDKEKSYLIFSEIRTALEKGEIRTAQKIKDTWVVNSWVKEAILWGFRIGVLSGSDGLPNKFFDKNTLPVQDISLGNKIRIVPGGSSVRGGAYVAQGTIIMPPSYINIGAYVDEGCMIDSHALVGSCAQVGKKVHLSAASQIGGVLEPAGALPVIIEDNVFIGGNCGIYEGTIIKQNAVIGTGVILNAATPVFDNTTGEFIKKQNGIPLTIPANAVVIAGSRPITGGHGLAKNIHVYCPVIIKYRDDKTGKSITLEDMLR
ncbi:MAG: 2,3,4,5-tetrahydropyridine-2,6-dicarboxylate N-succinyltransferase [Ignavibacteria bacterium]|nr:2,3,4,5-tetrahydropyridine-2,6-dicarboxylate N-succinyltransferase [Ignavibacteria bacterium]